ncbi:MAG: hypothetical protein WCN98_14980, partial [Verrucomicrobiaceae bacterium]
MGFSLRSFFGKGSSSHGSAGAPTATMPPPVSNPAPESPFQPAVGESPFANALLFKTSSSSETLGQPVQAAPFSPFAPAGTNPSSGLTVGDLLPGLPMDVSRNSSLSPLQPIVLPEAILESALRSGRATVPIFELFRACPAMFQMPVSPHDPREVPLPMGKITHLLSPQGISPNAGMTSAQQNNPSLFGFGAHLAAAQNSPLTKTSPFGMASPIPATELAAPTVEPLYQPSPFSMPEAQPFAPAPQADSPGSFAMPHSASSNPAPANPFFTASGITAASPFSMAPEPPANPSGQGGLHFAPPTGSAVPAASPFGSSARPIESQPQNTFGSGNAPHLFAPAAAPRPVPVDNSPPAFVSPFTSNFFEPKNAEKQDSVHSQPPPIQIENASGFFGQTLVPEEAARLETAQFGRPPESNRNLAATPPAGSAPSQPSSPSFGNASGETNPFFNTRADDN